MTPQPSRKRKPAAAPRTTAPLTSRVTQHGQTTIPAPLREKFGLRGGARLEWLDDGEMLVLVPIAADPIEQFRGKSRATLTLNVLRDRKVQRSREG